MTLLGRVRGAAIGVALASGLVGFVGLEQVALAESKIAVIDMQRALAETERGLHVQSELRQILDRRQAELTDAKNRLVAKNEEFEKDKKNPKVSRETLEKKAEELQRKYAEFQQMELAYQQDMQRVQYEKTQPIVRDLDVIVQRIATQDGFDLVLEKSAVRFSRRDLDITDRAIMMLNSSTSGETGTKPPPATDPKTTPPAKPTDKAPAKK